MPDLLAEETMIIEDEDYAYETNRQRKLDLDWTQAEDEAVEELSFRQDQQLKELETA